MKQIIALLILAGSACASDIGSTLPQLQAKYGNPVKTEQAWCGNGTAYLFSPSGHSRILAIVPGKTQTCEDIVYAENPGLTKEEALKKFDGNLPGEQRAERGRTLKNERSMTRNPLTHQVQVMTWIRTDTGRYMGSKESRVGNEYGKANKGSELVDLANWNGFQVRSAEQYKAEQRAIKLSENASRLAATVEIPAPAQR